MAAEVARGLPSRGCARTKRFRACSLVLLLFGLGQFSGWLLVFLSIVQQY